MVRGARLRQVLWTIHRWTGIALLVLLVPIAVSGALLVYHDEFDALLNPKRWTVTGTELALSPSQYLARAKALAPNETGDRHPISARSPDIRCVVLARQQAEPAAAGVHA